MNSTKEVPKQRTRPINPILRMRLLGLRLAVLLIINPIWPRAINGQDINGTTNELWSGCYLQPTNVRASSMRLLPQ